MIFIKVLLVVVLAIFLGLSAYVRLATVTPADWHLDLAKRPLPMGPPSLDRVTVLGNGAYVDLGHAPLQRFAAVVNATPRTRQIAGSVSEGRITWQTRSLLWGFPDFTTAQVSGDGLIVFSRARDGAGDWGVNARRLTAWIASL